MKKTLSIALILVAGSLAAQTVGVPFEGTCVDPEDGDISASLVWLSDVDGQVGSGPTGTMTLTEGPHTITAQCSDSHGNQSEASVSITVNYDESPAVVILAPADGSQHEN